MKILLTGAAGQLSHALRQQLPAGVELIATSRSGDGGGADGGLLPLDLADSAACRAAVLEHRPDGVLNGGAYTAVDRAESEPELALAVNGGAPRALTVDTSLRSLATEWVSVNGVGREPWECGAAKPIQSLVDPQTRLHRELIGLLRQHSAFCDQRHLLLLGWMVAGLLLSQTVCFDRWNSVLPLGHCLAASWQRRC
ncbi:sugar nucleotide-binding protein, partial [Microcystis elabens FACHB-917]|nr:sugar nucleotide-binding protein [Microcystis elabens FACHB-917]